MSARPDGDARILPLDGLRGVAILVVFADHAVRIPLGWVGVDVFFVLSGFLITGILLRSKQARAEGRSRGFLLPFYVRRFFRIVPPYVLVLVVYRLVYHRDDLHPWPLFVFFGMNLQPFFYADGPGDLPLWSLAVEEQFYLVWPFIVLLVPERVLLRLAAAALVITPVLRALGTLWLHNEFYIYTLTPFRADALCAGACIAVLWRHRSHDLEARLCGWAGIASVASFSMLAVLYAWPYFRLSHNEPLANALCYSLSVIGSAALLAWALAGAGRLHALLRWAPLRYIGRVSYSMYLVHIMVLVQLARFVSLPWLIFAAFAVSVLYATLSWYLVERPVLSATAGLLRGPASARASI